MSTDTQKTAAAEKSAHDRRDREVDEQLDETFPASDPPSTTPEVGSRRAEQAAAEKDPHGVKVGGAPAEADAAGVPHDDRGATEHAAGVPAGTGAAKGRG